MSGLLTIAGWALFIGVFIIAPALPFEIRRRRRQREAIARLRARYEQPPRLASFEACEQIWELPTREPGRRPRC